MILKKLNTTELTEVVDTLNEYGCTAKAANGKMIPDRNGHEMFHAQEVYIDAKSLLGMMSLMSSPKTETINLVLDEFDNTNDMIELTKKLSPFLEKDRQAAMAVA